MNLAALARIGESRRHRLVAWCCSAALLAGLAACGGGSESTGTPPSASGQPVSPSGSVQPGELPSELLLAEPRTTLETSQIALAWSSEGAFTGSIVAQIEFGEFTSSAGYTLQHNGAPAFYGAPGDSDEEGPVPFELRYADGFFVLTAQSDSPFGPTGLFGVDIYPPDVPRVPPYGGVPPCPGNGTEFCTTSLGFINNGRWPRVAGESVSLLIPRADPTDLTYTALVTPNASCEAPTARRLPDTHAQSAVMERGGPAWQFDFPTARVRLQGCNAFNACVESAEQPLQRALLDGVIAIKPFGEASNAHVALGANGNLLAVKGPFSDNAQTVLIHRKVQGSWRSDAFIQDPAPGFGRTFALSGDGTTLAVEASECAVATLVCDASSVFVYRAGDAFDSTWTQQARFDGVRAPRLSRDGNRMATIAIPAQRGDAVVAFSRNGTTWSEQAFPALDYTPLDIELSGDGGVLVVARQGTRGNPCCRAVVAYSGGNLESGWQQKAVLQSSKLLAQVGSPDDDGFGFAKPGTHSLALSTDGNMIAVGASLDSSDASDTVGDPNNHGATNSGAVYLFVSQGDTWSKQAFIKARGAKAHDHLGHAVALSEDGGRLFAGARGLSANEAGINRTHAGDQPLPSPMPGQNGALTGAAAYVFEHAGAQWVQLAAMAAPNASRANFDTHFALAVSGSTVALSTGEPAASSSAPGATRSVFVY